jgi:hypothetical protein
MPSPPETPDLQPTRPRWVLLVHQLPASPSNLRVRTWRRLQQLGAIAVKQSVYVLPDSPAAREDFEWLRTEIEGSGGEASVFVADVIDGRSDAALEDDFRRARETDYAALLKAIEQRAREQRRAGARARKDSPRQRQRLETLRQRLSAIERVDFFGGGGRSRVLAALSKFEGEKDRPPAAATRTTPPPDLRTFCGRLWVTRPRPGVDRMASAWLIRRFIDERATFAFAERPPAGTRQIPFDMFGVEFGHTALGCTFETLAGRFGLQSPALERIAHIVHDVDLKDAKFRPVEAPAFEPLVDGLRHAFEDDKTLLDHGMRLFEALFRAFDAAARTGAGRASRARQTGAGATATATAKARTPTTRKRARR